MAGNIRRRKSKHQKGGFWSVLLVFFLMLQPMVIPLTAAYAVDDQTDISLETEESDEALYDIPDVDMDENTDEDTDDPFEQVTDDEQVEEEEEDQASEETADDDLDTGQETEEENEITDQLEEIEAGDNDLENNDPESNVPDENCEEPENDKPEDNVLIGLGGIADPGEEEKTDEPAVYSAKAPPELFEEEIQEKKDKADAEEEKSRRMLPEEEEDTDSDSLVRSSDTSPKEMPRSIYRLHISALDLAVTAVHHADYAIQDMGGNILDTLTLSDDNGWQADWERIGEEQLTLTVEEVALFDNSGNNITSDWTSQRTAEDEISKPDPYNGWDVADAFEIGAYVIEFGSGENKQLLAVDNPNGNPSNISSVKYWKLSREASEPENASDSAIWIINTNSYGCLIKNAALADKNAYLTARRISRRIQFVLSDDDFNIYAQFENHRLSSIDNYYSQTNYLSVTSDGMKGVTTEAEATELTIYRFVTYNDTVYDSAVSFRHTKIPPPVLNTSVTIKLLVSGNVGERDRDFLFYASVNGGEEKTFSLSHQGECVLGEIPIGSELTVSMEAPGYQISASFDDGEETEDSLTVSSVPTAGGMIVFRAKCNAKLETGIHMNSSGYMYVLMAVFLGLLSQPLINIRMKSNSTNGKGENLK